MSTDTVGVEGTEGISKLRVRKLRFRRFGFPVRVSAQIEMLAVGQMRPIDMQPREKPVVQALEPVVG